MMWPVCSPPRAAPHLIRVEWGSEPREGEGHGGCYDNLIMVFEKCVSSEDHVYVCVCVCMYYSHMLKNWLPSLLSIYIYIPVNSHTVIV